MAAADIRPFALWVLTFFPSVLCCPEHCTCSDKHGRHFADCSYKYLSKVPDGFPPNVTTLSLSANQITMIPLASLVHLLDFPWGDLRNLPTLELLKMNHNKLSHLPGDALSNLKNLRSIRLNNNRLTTIAEGTFEGLVSLSHLQIFSNPFVCTCSLDWLRDWISTTTISVPDQSLIICAAPKELKGEAITKSKCMSPNVNILTEPHVTNMVFHEKTKLNLTSCADAAASTRRRKIDPLLMTRMLTLIGAVSLFLVNVNIGFLKEEGLSEQLDAQKKKDLAEDDVQLQLDVIHSFVCWELNARVIILL
uniref:LRRCT domain-containing protein n=1 Tax=Fundulus heteroclitus TaxID=8078 RepID=A0A3Q2R240_FUNHE